MNAARILLADGEAVVRSALRIALSQVPGAEIVGEASHAEQAVRCVAQNHPSIVLLSWELPGHCPEALLAKVRALAPGLRIIALSAQPEARKAALEAGADAFVSKVEPPERLLAALQACMDRNGP